MTPYAPASILLVGPEAPLSGILDAWVRTHFAEPLTVVSVATVPDALRYLQSHRVDLMLVDEATARTELRTIHTASPTTAIIGLVMKMDEPVQLLMLRQGVHEVLCLLPSAEANHSRLLQRALARVNGRTDILTLSKPRPDITATPTRLIHDLNNLLTSINGFADLLLTQLTPDHPARMSAEQIRLAGKRAATLLKAHTPPLTSASSSAPTAPPITARAA